MTAALDDERNENIYPQKQRHQSENSLNDIELTQHYSNFITSAIVALEKARLYDEDVKRYLNKNKLNDLENILNNAVIVFQQLSNNNNDDIFNNSNRQEEYLKLVSILDDWNQYILDTVEEAKIKELQKQEPKTTTLTHPTPGEPLLQFTYSRCGKVITIYKIEKQTHPLHETFLRVWYTGPYAYGDDVFVQYLQNYLDICCRGDFPTDENDLNWTEAGMQSQETDPINGHVLFEIAHLIFGVW